MNDNSRTLVILLIFAAFFKGIVWASLVPIWQAPDEQAHFAQVQYYAEEKKEISGKNDLSQEVFKSESLLGTLRDKRGNNKFTYHPEYRIKYSDTFIGIHEEEIASLSQSSRTTYVKREAARYPPLFYVISSIGYLTGYQGDLFIRLSLTRIISVLFAVLTVWISFLLAKTIFPKNLLLSTTIACFVSFQPMFSFLSSGVNNDNLLNLLATILLWLIVKAMKEGMTTILALAMGLCLGLGIITKQVMYPFIPLPLFAFAYRAIKEKNLRASLTKIFPFLLAATVFGGIIFIQKWKTSGNLPYWPRVSPESPRYSFTISQYLSNKLPQLYRETFPWYWGVFKWLGVVLPLTVLRLIKVTLFMSALGIARYAIEKVKTRKIQTQDWQLLFLIFSSIWFIFWILLWDYMLIRSIGFSHGLQGRNFFPNIAAHMTLFAFGLYKLSNPHKEKILKVAMLAMVFLNFIALRRLVASYYALKPLATLILQASQYKPWFFKGALLVVWFIIYCAIVISFSVHYLRLKRRKT